VVLVGPATRLARYLTGHDKVYEARVAFGAETDTEDAEGAVTRTADVPVELAHAPFASRALREIVGRHDQVPPSYSAVSVEGRRAHRLARDGVAVILGARPVEVLAADLVAVYDTLAWDVRLRVSKGTYVRSIARDLGRDLGTAAHLTALRRLESGALTIADARPLADVEAAGRAGRAGESFADPFVALGLRALAVTDADDVARVASGAALRPPADLADGDRVALAVDGRLRAVYVRRGESLRAETVLGPGS
jgi:tRNA pseudouridine55 synthase